MWAKKLKWFPLTLYPDKSHFFSILNGYYNDGVLIRLNSKCSCGKNRTRILGGLKYLEWKVLFEAIRSDFRSHVFHFFEVWQNIPKVLHSTKALQNAVESITRLHAVVSHRIVALQVLVLFWLLVIWRIFYLLFWFFLVCPSFVLSTIVVVCNFAIFVIMLKHLYEMVY